MRVFFSFALFLLAVTCVCSLTSEQSDKLRNAKFLPNNIQVSPKPTKKPLTPTTHHNGTVRGRIINGKIATSITQFPYQVKLAIRSISQSTPVSDAYMECGGSIIAPNWIVTAAHCVLDGSGGYVYFGCVNTADFTNGCDITEVTKADLFPHESYNGRIHQNDIALVRLQSPLTFSSITNKIVLNKNATIPVGKLAVLSGYGQTETGQTSDVLRYTTVSIISNADCYYVYPFITSSVICYDGYGTTSACHGDSGGPMTIQDSGKTLLVGVTSFGSDVCEQYPGVYTRISSYISWICSKSDVC